MDKIVSRKNFRRVSALILAAVTILSMFFALPVGAKTGDKTTMYYFDIAENDKEGNESLSDAKDIAYYRNRVNNWSKGYSNLDVNDTTVINDVIYFG